MFSGLHSPHEIVQPAFAQKKIKIASYILSGVLPGMSMDLNWIKKINSTNSEWPSASDWACIGSSGYIEGLKTLVGITVCCSFGQHNASRFLDFQGIGSRYEIDQGN